MGRSATGQFTLSFTSFTNVCLCTNRRAPYQNLCRQPIRAPVQKCHASRRKCTVVAPQCKVNRSVEDDVSSLRLALVEACTGLNRGLDFDPDADVETKEEELVEDLAERLEDLNPCSAPTESSNMHGSWDLLYTSSTLARYTRGLSGLHKYVNGKVGRIVQHFDPEDGTCTFSEQISYSLPLVAKPASETVVIRGRIRNVNETRQIWTPENIKASWLRLWAENWKSLRAFTNAETTYLDKYIRITRGQNGSLNIFGRTQPADTNLQS